MTAKPLTVTWNTERDDERPKALDEVEVVILKAFNWGPSADTIKQLEQDIEALNQEIVRLVGIQESDTGLACVCSAT